MCFSPGFTHMTICSQAVDLIWDNPVIPGPSSVEPQLQETKVKVKKPLLKETTVSPNQEKKNNIMKVTKI